MRQPKTRLVVTGMAINTPLADELDLYLRALLDGRSAISRWRSIDVSRIACKIGGDLGGYDVDGKLDVLRGTGAQSTAAVARAAKLVKKVPWSAGLSAVLAIDAWRDAGLFDVPIDVTRSGVLVGGYHLSNTYHQRNVRTFDADADAIDALYALQSIETTQAACISEILGLRGIASLVSAACASGLYALRSAADEIREHQLQIAVVVGAATDLSALDLQALAILGAVSQDNFNDDPERASRPFDVRREGFVPAHGAAAIIVEDAAHAARRGARVYAEISAVETSADASHSAQPSEDGQCLAMARALDAAGLDSDAVDYINGHFTATPLGDVVETRAISRLFGDHARRLKSNATKSMIGHTMGASGIVELVGGILQMRASRLHPTRNVDEIDPAVTLDVCANGPAACRVRHFMKNAFGFGGLNASAVVAAPTEGNDDAR
jgi:3-oxoacyl-(acyl-carrier-protein) synthase